MVTQETCCLLVFIRDRATLGGKTRTSTKVISWPAMLFVKHHAEVKAFRLPCGNPAAIYTSSSSSLQGTKGCLGEAHFTLQRTGSITAHFAAFAGRAQSGFCESSTYPMQYGIHSLESHQCSHEPVREQTMPCSGIHSSSPARVMGDGDSRLPSA